MRNIGVALAVTVVLSVSLPVSAHHSHANYDQTNLLRLEGIVQGIRWVNPHVWIQLNVRNGNGELEPWTLEGPSTAQLASLGWSRDEIKSGDTIQVRCYRLKSGDNGCLLRFMTLQGSAERPFD